MRSIQIGSKVVLLGVLSVLYSCTKEQCQEEPPSLEFYEYEYKAADPNNQFSTDSLLLRLQFVDCQGDIGVSKVDDSTKNLRTYLYESINGEWKRFIPANEADTVLFFAQIPRSNKLKDGQKAEGVIQQAFGSVRQNSDTIRFETRLFDRAGNKSERIVTPPFIIPQ